MPRGLDAVVPAEYASEQDGRLAITRAVAPGQHVGHVGEDIARGSTALAAGRRLRPQDAGLAASLGLAQLQVVRRPRVRLLVTGNEVRAPGTSKGPSEIYDANSVTLRGLVARDGGLLESHQRLGDDPQIIAQALAAPGADVVLISGGSSVGAEDHAPRLLAELGELAIHGIAMRPSSPAGMGASVTRWCSCCRATRSPACAPTTSLPGVRSASSAAGPPTGPTRARAPP